LAKGECFQSLIYAPFYLQFSNNGLELVSISRKNANPPSASGVSSNRVLYPNLQTNPEWPVPLWKVPTQGTSLVVSECPRYTMAPEYVGDCTKCTKAAS
jgi:hypothetical protein